MPGGNAIPNKIVIAIGGNATHPDDIEGTSEQQEAIAAKTAQSLLQIGQEVDQLIITHGNGPVVGKILMRQALTRDRISPMPLEICEGHSQGGGGVGFETLDSHRPFSPCAEPQRRLFE